MCGFAGFISRAPEVEHLSPMLARVVHRGPDGEGRWSAPWRDWSVSLGHRRLAILDIEGGAQPMHTPHTSGCLAYNGELYNFRELRRELEAAGTLFKTRSDTEVLLHHGQMHWARGLPALNGMFAFALWDGRLGRLLLARDRVGIKPLYYTPLPDGGVAFASELTALMAHPGVGRRLSAEGLESYFFCDYVPAPLSLIEGVSKVPPGHFVEWKEGRLSAAVPYFTVDAEPRATASRTPVRARALWSRLGSAVESQLVADVPVGVFLSGGIDSSVVATLAQERSGQSLSTFSIGFDDPTFDESPFARQVAKHIGSKHVEETLSQGKVLEVVETALSMLDEPLADPSYLPTFLVSKLAASHVKVVLGGDGGDELFGGYVTYRAHQFASWYGLLPNSLRSAIAGAAVTLRERDSYQSLEWKLKRFVLRWDDDIHRRHLRWMSSLDLPDLKKGLTRATGALPATMASLLPGLPGSLNGLLALDFATYLPGSVLTKVDRASMAHGLEVRPPMLDNEIVALAFGLPPSLKLYRGQSKYLLKLAARGHLPDAIIDRKKKGFGIPLGAWLRGPLRERLERALSPSPLWESGLLNLSAFAEWARLLDARAADYSKPLWALVVLDEWVRREDIQYAPSAAERPVPHADASSGLR